MLRKNRQGFNSVKYCKLEQVTELLAYKNKSDGENNQIGITSMGYHFLSSEVHANSSQCYTSTCYEAYFIRQWEVTQAINPRHRQKRKKLPVSRYQNRQKYWGCDGPLGVWVRLLVNMASLSMVVGFLLA